MAGKSSGDRRKPLRGAKGDKNAAPAKSIRVGVIDYKDVPTLRKFISERGKIRARRITGVSVQEQRLIARAVLDGTRDEALFLDGDAGDATCADLSTLGDELTKGGDIFLIDDTNPDRLRGGGVFATLSTAERLAAVAARLSSHDFLTFLGVM